MLQMREKLFLAELQRNSKFGAGRQQMAEIHMISVGSLTSGAVLEQHSRTFVHRWKCKIYLLDRMSNRFGEGSVIVCVVR